MVYQNKDQKSSLSALAVVLFILYLPLPPPPPPEKSIQPLVQVLSIRGSVTGDGINVENLICLSWNRHCYLFVWFLFAGLFCFL